MGCVDLNLLSDSSRKPCKLGAPLLLNHATDLDFSAGRMYTASGTGIVFGTRRCNIITEMLYA